MSGEGIATGGVTQSTGPGGRSTGWGISGGICGSGAEGAEERKSVGVVSPVEVPAGSNFC